jgi:hypothetical protein
MRVKKGSKEALQLIASGSGTLELLKQEEFYSISVADLHWTMLHLFFNSKCMQDALRAKKIPITKIHEMSKVYASQYQDLPQVPNGIVAKAWGVFLATCDDDIRRKQGESIHEGELDSVEDKLNDAVDVQCSKPKPKSNQTLSVFSPPDIFSSEEFEEWERKLALSYPSWRLKQRDQR